MLMQNFGGISKEYYGIVLYINMAVFQSESKCEIFVMVISANFNMNENWFS